MAEQWVPHKWETWPWVLATLKKPVEFRYWEGAKRDATGNPIFVCHTRAVGTSVKIVMVSRLGDVGITDDLNAVNGYAARVLLDDLIPTTPTTEPHDG